ncbi:MAG: hypothetical protein JRJ03_11295 [Deltaproteobacteria bacterium]|nr:hypothetical protein [Deltaproteobacteria bacterium]
MEQALLRLEKALLPYQKKLKAQERFRRLLGVRQVEAPTYQKYIIGVIERFDRRKTAFKALEPDNPYGEDFRKQFRSRTGHHNWTTPLPYTDLDPYDRIGQSLSSAA